MTINEEKIQYLFDDFALELSPRPELAEKARKQMSAKKKTRTVWVRVMALCAVVLVVYVGMALALLKVVRETPVTYAQSDVIGHSADLSAENISQLQAISQLKTMFEKDDCYNVLSEKCLIYTFKSNGNFAYAKIRYGILTENGMVEMDVIVESSDCIKADLKDIYKINIKNNKGEVHLSVSAEYIGERVTSAYWEDNVARYYISAQCNGQAVDDAQKIIDLISELGTNVA